MMLANHFKFNTTLSKVAMAISIIVMGTSSAISQITVNGTTVNVPSGTVENTGAIDDTSAVIIYNNGSFIADGDLSLSTKGQNSNGISLNDGSGGTATVTNGNLSINTTGFNSSGVNVANDAIATIANGAITTQGYLGDGLRAAGTGTIIGNNLNIETHGYQAYGADIVSGTSSTLSNLKLSQSVINTFGDVATAIQVDSSGVADVDSIQINTHGFNANGVLAQGSSKISLINGNINTEGDYSHALHASSDATVLAEDINIITTGDVAYGIYSEQNGHSKFSNGNISTSGANSDGARVVSGATLNIDRAVIDTQGQLSAGIRSDGSILSIQDSQVTTHGDGSYGLDAINSGAVLNANNVNVTTSGNMEPTGNTSSAVVAEFGGTINIAGNSSIQTSGTNGIGLLAQVSGANLPDSVINAGDGINVLNIKTTGNNSFGVEACSLHGDGIDCKNSLLDNIGSGDISVSSKAIVNINKAAIATSGQNAYGLYTISQDSKINATGVSVDTTGEAAHAITMLRGGEIIAVDSQVQAHGDQADGARISGGTINNSVASLSLKNTNLISDNGNGVYVEPGDSIISLDHSQLKGKKNSLLTASTGNTTFNAVNGSIVQGNMDASGNLSVTLNNSQLSGDIISRLGDINPDALSITTANNSIITGSMTSVSSVNLSDSQWNMTESSTITGLISQQTGGLQLNNSQVNFVPNGQNYKMLTTSSLSGAGTFTINTELNDGGSNTHSDQLHITGNTAGDYNLLVNNTVGTGAQTVDDGIQIAKLDGNSAGTSVTLGRPVTAGAYEYLLYQGGSQDKDDWYLRSQLSNPDPTPDPTPEPPPSYNPSVPGYVIGPYLNRMYGFDTVGTLHERVGDQENLRKKQDFNQGVWGRIHGGETKSYAGRFNYDAQTWFAQFGGDLYQSYSESGARTHAGITATLGQVSTDAKDALRPLYKGHSDKTGSVNSKGYGFGVYYTRYAADSSYIDTVAQYTHYHNEYDSIYGDNTSQGGDGITLSVEVGKPFKNTDGWFVEPQAQIMYQYLHLDSMNDGVAAVSSTNDNSGLVRVGARAGYDSVATSNVHPYITADVLSVIGRSPDVTVSGTTLNQDYSDQWGEVGGGVTGDITKNTTVYADLKYKQGFDGNMHGFTGNLGVRVNW